MATNGYSLSRSGIVMLLACAVINSASIRQRAVTLSTAESECYALCYAVRLTLAMRRIIAFIAGCSIPSTIVYEDNAAVISQIARRDLTARTRYLKVNLAFIIDAIESNEIVLEFYRTHDQLANTLTKAEDREMFLRSRDMFLGTVGASKR